MSLDPTRPVDARALAIGLTATQLTGPARLALDANIQAERQAAATEALAKATDRQAAAQELLAVKIDALAKAVSFEAGVFRDAMQSNQNLTTQLISAVQGHA